MEKLKGRKILILDAIGAFFSMLCLVGLYTFDEQFGMPKSILRVLLVLHLFFLLTHLLVTS
jgi:hypothetical protein